MDPSTTTSSSSEEDNTSASPSHNTTSPSPPPPPSSSTDLNKQNEHQQRYLKRKLPLRSAELNTGLLKKRYKGQLTSRAALQLEDSPFELDPTNVSDGKGGAGVYLSGDDDEDIDFGSDDEDNEVEWKEDKEKEEEERMKREMERLEREEKEEENETGSLIRARNLDVLKGKAVLEQKTLYDNLLNIRIRMQPLLDDAMRLPRPEDRDQYSELDDEIQKANDVIQSLVESLEKAHLSILSSTKVVDTNSKRKYEEREEEEDEDIDSDEASVAEDDDDDDEGKDDRNGDSDVRNLSTSEIMEKFMSWKDKELDEWGRRVDDATGRQLAAKSKFKAVDLSISGQIRRAFQDEGRLRKRANRVRGKVDVIGKGEVERDVDEEHFCDADFYQALLRDVIEGNDNGGIQRMIRLRRKNRKKKGVDRKARKGRKIRYVVHDKLVGFLAPVAMKEMPAMDQIVKSLFGGSSTKSLKDEDKKTDSVL